MNELVPISSRLVLTAFDIMGNPALEDQRVYDLKEIVIPPSQTFFDFEFADLQYLSSFLKNYSYKLEGFDKDWIYSGARNYGSYTNISSGSYILKIRSLQYDGTWGEENRVIIKILPPLWKSPIAYLVYGFLILLVLILIVYLIYLNNRKKNQKISEQEDSNRKLEDEIRIRTAQIEQEKEQLSVTLRNITDAVISTDTEGNVRFLNTTAKIMFDVTLEEVIGQRIVSLLENRGPALTATIEAVLRDMVKGDAPRHSDSLIAVGALSFRMAHAAIKDDQGEVKGVVFVLRDVTDEIEMQNRLQKHDKLESLGVLAGGIAHDFNNLLVGVFGYMELASLTSTEDEIKTLLSLALDPFERAKSLTQQLLTFAKGGNPIRATIDLTQLIQASVQFSLSGSNVGYEIDVEEPLWQCDIDKNQVSQVFDNLCINAKQAMPSGGTVQVSVKNSIVYEHMGMDLLPGEYIQIKIKDSGLGIEQDHLHKIFDPFFTTKLMGSGLGLTTCYSIITQHNGNIYVSSKLQEGTTFTIYLPRSLSSIDAEVVKEEPQEKLDLHGVLLLLDDESSLVNLTEAVLKRIGIEVLAISDGKEIPRILEEGYPLIGAILDLTIPGGVGGVGIVEELRLVYPDIPIFASSGYSNDPVIADPQKYGFTDSIQKPYTINELYGLIRSHITDPKES